MNIAWLAKMAWRDSRKNLWKLLLFVSSIIIGIAALVAINSFDDNLRENIENQSKELLGADLVVNSNKAFTAFQDSIINTISPIKTLESDLISMAYFEKSGGTRLTRIRAFDGDFPYYGKIVTDPPDVSRTYYEGRNALLDKTLMVQYNCEIGDKVKVGETSFTIVGQINSIPGSSAFTSAAAPTVMIPLKYLAETNLVQPGSRVEYARYFKFEQEPTEAELEQLSKILDDNRIRSQNIQERKRRIGKSFENANIFFNLIAFIALLLGCVGVASAVHVYMKSKVKTVAVLRCLGVSGKDAFIIYLIQITIMGTVGAIIGTILGSLIQKLLPIVLQNFLPVKVTMALSPTAILEGIVTGIVVSVLFALLPLLDIRKISPLKTLRVSDENKASKDPLRWLVYATILLGIFGFMFYQTKDFRSAAIFSAFVLLSFLTLTLVSFIIMWSVKKFVPKNWSFVFRQGLSNLYRPNNQTLILITSIGLGTAMISILFFMQGLLLGQVEFAGRGEQPNMLLYDIQADQVEGILDISKEFEMPILQNVPLVTMKLAEINGRTVQEIAKDEDRKVSRGALGREARVTFRDTLVSSETIIDGSYHAAITNPDDTVFISIAKRYQEFMHVDVGDQLLFDVQGTLIPTVIKSVRKVDWTSLQSNFFIVFPTGVLEEAPQQRIVVTRTPTPEVSALFQRSVVEDFPNVSVVDLTLILKTVEDILGKISFVIQFMAFFSILTGLLVLIGSVIISKFQRIQESVLLRTLGSTRRQILWIYFVEYFVLGSLASLSGILLSLGGSWALAKFIFKLNFTTNLLPILIVYLGVTGLTVFIGMLNSRGILSRPPLEVLRENA